MNLLYRWIRFAAMMLMAVGTAIQPPVAEAQCITPPGLVVGWWKGEGNANGSSGGNNAEWRGNRIAYGAGKVGQGFDLNGSSYLSAPALDLSGYSGFTLQAWIKTTNISLPYGQDIFRQQKPLNGPNFVLAFTEYGQSLVFLVHAGGVTESGFVVPIIPSDWADGAWHLITATYDGQAMKVYRDNQLIASRPRNGRVDFLPPDSLSIGSGFNGTLDEPIVFGWPLSDSQVAAVYNAGSAGMCLAAAECIEPPGLVVGWWKGDGNANDYFGANNAEWRGDRTAYSTGKVGQGFDLNGTSYLSTPALDLSGYSGFTLQAWIKTTNISLPYGQDIFRQQKPLNGINFVLAFTEYGQSLVFLVHAGGVAEGGLVVPITPSDWADGAWHLITATHDGQVMKVYRDDQLIASQPRNARVDFLPPDSLHIGSGFNGTLDEPIVFGWPLSDSQVAAVYNAGSAGMCLRCAARPSGLVAWWPGDGAANSLMGSYDATLSAGVSFASGIVDQSFAFDGLQGAVVAPRINLNSTASLTLQAWIKPRNVSAKQSYDIIEQRPPGGQPDWRLAIEDYGQTLSFGLLAGGQYRELDIPIDAVYYTNEVWHLITATYDGGLMRVYKNGQLIGSLPSVGFVGFQNGGAFQIGGPITFDGYLDEVMVLSRALSSVEINQIHAAGQAGVCKVRILSKPVNTLLVCGSPASLSVLAINASSYQWQLNGADIAGATNSTYAIASARNSDAGVYTVVVRDGSGGSVRATASMGFSFLDLKRYAGVQVTAGVGASVRIEAVNDTRNPGSWQVLTNIASLPTNPYLFIDYDSVVYPNRFYRVVNQNCP